MPIIVTLDYYYHYADDYYKYYNELYYDYFYYCSYYNCYYNYEYYYYYYCPYVSLSCQGPHGKNIQHVLLNYQRHWKSGQKLLGTFEGFKLSE